MRRTDSSSTDYTHRRRFRQAVREQVYAEPGNLIVSPCPTTIGAVVSSTVVITLFDRRRSLGGLCHYALPKAAEDVDATPVYGLSGTVALIRAMLSSGSRRESMVAGIYGGACPEAASPDQRALAQANVKVATKLMALKEISVVDEDTGGARGRKLWYLTSTNEMAIIKTSSIRRSDWFPYGTEQRGRQ